MTPEVSIIMPVYNAERYLRDCLDSILGQTLCELEVFCINDGSTDSSAQILDEYAKKDVRIKLLRTEHVGAYLARHEGYIRSAGRFLYYMDADDTLDRKALQELRDMADRDNLDQIVFSASVFTDDDDDTAQVRDALARFEQRYELPKSVQEHIKSGVEIFDDLMAASAFFPSPPLRLIRASTLKDNPFGFPDAPFHGDNYFTLVSLFYAKRAVVIGTKYYRRRIRSESMTTGVGNERIQFISTFNVILELCRFKPFSMRLQAGNVFAALYLRKLTGSLSRWGSRLGEAGCREALDRVAPDDLALAAFLRGSYLPLLVKKGKSAKPPVIRRVKNMLRRMLRG